MKKLSFLTLAALAATAGAYDEYGPMAVGKTEVDVMASYDISPDAGGFTPSLQAKYGIVEGLDVEVLVEFPTDPEFGSDRPNIALKYNHAATGFGGFVAVDLPVASDKIDGDPKVGFTFAGQYLKTFDKIVLNDWLYFGSTFQDGDDGEFDLYVKPQYNVTDKIGPYLGLEWMTSGKFEGYMIALKPGINYVVNEMVSVEGQVPVAKTKGVDDLEIGAFAGVYFVF